MKLPLKNFIVYTTLFCFSTESYAQKKTAPYDLRIDLMQHPEQVYDHGLPKTVSLEQAVQQAGRWQFCKVNSLNPSFSWSLHSRYQSAYQVLIASSKALLGKNVADAGNTGKIKSTTNTGILYDGNTLKASTIYYWKVRTWDEKGQASAYSPVQTFCTGKMLAAFQPPSFVLMKTLEQPQQLIPLQDGHLLYDFAKDAFGQLRLTVTTQAHNDTLFIHLGEALSADGHINRKPRGTIRYRMLKVPLTPGQHMYIPAIAPDKRNTGLNAVLVPEDIGEVLPFRYAEIEIQKKLYSIDTVSRYMISHVFDDEATSFNSSDSNLNRLWNLCKHTIKATSFTGYYVDGDRERIPYEADALINQLSHYAADAEFNMAKRTLNYLIDHPTWPTEWSLQNIQIAWHDYLYSGDKRQLRKLYPELKAKLLTALAREDGLISTRTGKQTPAFLQSIHYGQFTGSTQLKDIVDWPQPGETDGFVFTDYNAVVNAWYYAGLKTMSAIAAALDNPDDATHYLKESINVQQAFQHSFFDRSTNLVTDGENTPHSSLHANLFALAFGLVPDDKKAFVLSFIHLKGMACSVYAAQFLLDALYQANDAVYALQLLTSTGKRSWLNMLHEGATMTMEAWGQDYKPNQDWNHAWGTAPINTIVRHIMGVQPLTPGFGKVLIQPQPGSVTNARLNYSTIAGKISVAFRHTKERFNLQLILPGNVIGIVRLPFSCTAGTKVKMNGRRVPGVYRNGYWQVDNVPPGQYLFEVAKAQ